MSPAVPDRPVTMLVLVRDRHELERAPVPADLDPEQARTPGWAAALALGPVVGAWVALVGVVSAGSPLGVGGALLVVVVGAVALVWPVRSLGPRSDPRLVLAAAGAVPLVVALVGPPAASHLAGRTTQLALAAALAAGALWLHRQTLVATAAVRAWNAAAALLVADPRRARRTELSLERVRVGTGHEYGGTVRYVGDDGQERAVPVRSARSLRLVPDGSVVADDGSACVVWHTPDHRVVLTRVLAD